MQRPHGIPRKEDKQKGALKHDAKQEEYTNSIDLDVEQGRES